MDYPKVQRVEMSTSEIDDRVIRAVGENEQELAAIVKKIARDAWEGGFLYECEYNTLLCGLRTHLVDITLQALPVFDKSRA